MKLNTKVKGCVNRIRRNKKLALVYLVIVLIGAFSVFYLFFYDSTTPLKAEPVVTYSTDKPSESKEEADNYNWQGKPDEPKKITIKKIGVDAFVQQMGVDQNKQIAVPNNVHLAGWFVDSRKPGQTGLSIIAGHVSGYDSDGVFKRLSELSKGDEFSIELGNGEVLNYTVIDTQTVKEKQSADILFSQDPKVKSQVNLITCGGQFDRDNRQYENRVIVSGELQ